MGKKLTADWAASGLADWFANGFADWLTCAGSAGARAGTTICGKALARRVVAQATVARTDADKSRSRDSTQSHQSAKSDLLH